MNIIILKEHALNTVPTTTTSKPPKNGNFQPFFSMSMEVKNIEVQVKNVSTERGILANALPDNPKIVSSNSFATKGIKVVAMREAK